MYGSIKSKKEKYMQQKAKTDNEARDTQYIILKLESRKWSLSEEHKSITKKQETQQEDLVHSRTTLYKLNQRLQDATNTKDMGKMTVVQGILDAANPKMEAAR